MQYLWLVTQALSLFQADNVNLMVFQHKMGTSLPFLSHKFQYSAPQPVCTTKKRMNKPLFHSQELPLLSCLQDIYLVR